MTGCPDCEAMQARLDAALQARDAALMELARAREELNRRRLADAWADEEPIPLYPYEAGAAWPVPLRYRLVDRVNGWVKGAAPGLQRLARAWVRRPHGG